MEGDQTAKLSSLGVAEKPRVRCHCHGHSGRFLLAGHLPNSRGGGREGVNPKTKKYSELSSTHHFTSLALETLGPINCEGLSFFSEFGQKLRPLPARCAKLHSFFSAFRLPFRGLTRWHLEGHLPAKTQTNCDSYDIKSATVNTAWTKRFLYYLQSV